MSELNVLFRRRIGFPDDLKLTFENLNNVLERTAKTIPFENLRVAAKQIGVVSESYLVDKILAKNEGGLCYELNALFYLFLIENGFDVALTTGVVYNHEKRTYSVIGRTHVAILLTYMEKIYLIDTGFGGNLPLKPVPITGEPVTSDNGEFRIIQADGEYGDYLMEMKLKHKDTDWKIGYVFDSKIPITLATGANAVQKMVAEHPESNFNKGPLLTKLTDGGNITLTDSTFTQWDNGTVTKEPVDDAMFEELAKKHFGIEIRRVANE